MQLFVQDATIIRQDDATICSSSAAIPMRLLIALFLLLGVATASARYGPSFSCDGKLSAVERLICTDDEASHLDAFLSMSYRQLKEWLSAEEWKDVVEEQRQWLAERDRCQETACIVAKIKERSNALGQRRTAAYKYVQSQLADKTLAHATIAAGMNALRQKYEDIDDTRAGPLTAERFDCFPMGYHKFRCWISIGSATCNDGTRDGGYIGFDVVASSPTDFRLSEITANEACGTPLPTRARH
jgi:uncharacterized protein